MKKQILDALKAKFIGVSEAILNRIADKLAKTVTSEEGVATAIEGVTLQQVIDSYGDSRATEATQSAVSNYEKRHGLKDGKPVNGGAPATKKEDEPDNDPEDDKNTPTWAKEIIESNKKLAERLNSIEGDKIASTRKQKLESIISKLPETLRKPYARTPVGDLTDEEFETLTNEIQMEVDGLVTESNVKGAVFGRPVNNGATQAGFSQTKEATEEEAKSVVDRMNI